MYRNIQAGKEETISNGRFQLPGNRSSARDLFWLFSLVCNANSRRSIANGFFFNANGRQLQAFSTRVLLLLTKYLVVRRTIPV
jgi:hypothetical protein